MKYKLYKYGIIIGLSVSVIGFIFLKTDLLTENYINTIHNIYRLTLIISIIFILSKSIFIKERFNHILKALVLIFLLIFGMNLLNEFNIYEIKSIRIISYILFCSLLVIYTYHFIKKKNKNQLDFFKLGFIILCFIGGFLNLFNILPNNLKYIAEGIFWSVVLGMLYQKHKRKMNLINTLGNNVYN